MTKRDRVRDIERKVERDRVERESENWVCEVFLGI